MSGNSDVCVLLLSESIDCLFPGELKHSCIFEGIRVIWDYIPDLLKSSDEILGLAYILWRLVVFLP